MSKGFYIGEVLKNGWRTMKAHWGFVVAALILANLVGILPDIAAHYFPPKNNWAGALVVITKIILSVILNLGIVKVYLKLARHEKASFWDLINTFPLFLNYLGFSIIMAALTVVGTLLFVVPAVYWWLKYAMSIYFILDGGAGPIEAMRRSADVTNGVKWDLLAWGLVSIVVALLGALCLGIGLFAAFPTIGITTALIYIKLLEQTNSSKGLTASSELGSGS